MNNNHTGRTVLIVLLSLVLLAGAFSGGLIAGWLIPTPSQLESIKEVASPTQSTDAESTDLDTLFKPFWQSWQIVHEQFVDQPVDDNKLMEGAIRGMIAALGDQHSGYMDPEEFAQANMPLEGSYTGIGAWVDTTGEHLTIISPMPDSPAEKAGLKSGDEVIGVDGKDVSTVDPSIVLQSVLGPEGTTVVLQIQRPDTSGPLDFTIVRAKIEIPSIESKMLDNKVAYVGLYTFGESTAKDLTAALQELLAQDPVGLILDLRNNTGGYLDTAIKVVSQFIPDGVVMIEKSGDGQETKYEAIPGGIATKIPLVVLVNGGSASASEITAGAIQDRGRGKLVGTTTYGKGSVQNWVELQDNQGAVRVTVAHWLTPNGRLIHEIGLTPDYVVDLTEEDLKAGKDPQLDKAVELILNGE
jgi:carboxyl-terminal processing protease